MHRSNPKDQREFLSQTPAQSKLWKLSASELSTCKRFTEIKPRDWAYVYFGESLHFARVQGPLETSDSELFNLKNPHFPDGPRELFKFRRLYGKKSFRLGLLPTSFLILRSAGRSNVYEHSNSYWHLVKMLADSSDEAEVCERFRGLSVYDWLDWAGDKTWESISESYLIFEREFVPTGLNVGGTLADLDIVGATKSGVRILGQCKKHPYQVAVESTFLDLCASFAEPKESYYFAFGGVLNVPSDIRVIDGDFMKNWLRTSANGQLYRKLLGLG